MQCRDVYELADSFLSEELLVETNHEVLRHLEQCPSCRADMAFRRQVREATRKAFLGSEALQMRVNFPADVTATLRTRAVPRAAFLRVATWWAIAASALVAVTVSLFFLSDRLAAMARDAVGDHRNCAVQFRLADRPISLAEAADRYDPAYRRLLDTPPVEITTTAGPIRVVDRHSCVSGGRRFAHIVVEFHRQLASILVTADHRLVPNLLRHSNSQPALTWLPPIDGFGVASFKTPGHIAFIVSALDEAAFRELTVTLSGPVYQRLMGA